MSDTSATRSIIEGAEQAASAGDYTSAARLLRQALNLQESRLGPHHAELANTLNNLGVVYDLSNDTIQAEQSYRRAFKIATSTLSANDPVVATSGKNLRDFCAARGLPFEVTPPSPRGAPPPPPSARPSPSGRSWSGFAFGLLPVGALAIVATLYLWPASRVPDRDPMPAPAGAVSAEEASAPAVETVVTAGEAAVVAEDVPDASSAIPAPPTPGVRPDVETAELCAAFSAREWRCTSAEATVESGTLFFYTRVRSAVDTTIVHRWYQGDRLDQQVELDIRTNLGAGYRTFSRNTVQASGDDWRVELRARDGTLLHEERFAVR